MGIIYCITFPNNKKYIGQTIRTLEKRLDEHQKNKECIAVYSAIQKYGFQNIKTEILLIINDVYLDYYEKKFIKSYNTICPNGYNIRTGGSNGKHCEESRERMRLSKLGSKNPNYGKPRTCETKNKISNKKRGEKHHFYGKQLKNEHKIKLSQSFKKYDKNLPMYISYVKERPECYCSAGYIVLYPNTKKKYFTSKKLTMEEKLLQATKYLEEIRKAC
jgi:group I intron endonuclease